MIPIRNHSLKGHVDRMGLFGPKKYIYLSVCFQGGKKTYCYRTEDKSIKVNDVVMVPVPNEPDKPAIVAHVDICTEKDAPYPPGKTKMISGRADRKNRKLFAGVDMRVSFDIARMRVKTKKGLKEIITTESQRKELRKKYGNDPNVKIIESCKPAKEIPKDDLAWIDELEMLDAIFDDK